MCNLKESVDKRLKELLGEDHNFVADSEFGGHLKFSDEKKFKSLMSPDVGISWRGETRCGDGDLIISTGRCEIYILNSERLPKMNSLDELDITGKHKKLYGTMKGKTLGESYLLEGGLIFEGISLDSDLAFNYRPFKGGTSRVACIEKGFLNKSCITFYKRYLLSAAHGEDFEYFGAKYSDTPNRCFDGNFDSCKTRSGGQAEFNVLNNELFRGV